MSVTITDRHRYTNIYNTALFNCRLLPDTRMIRMIILVEAQIILKISEQ